MQREAFFEALWTDFIHIAPQAAAIKERLEQFGEVVENDHVAFRTFDGCPLALERLEPLIVGLGYRVLDEYHFQEKHLRARAYVCPGAPRVFLSELVTHELSATAQRLIRRCTDQVAEDAARSVEVFSAGRLWDPLTFAEYEQLSSESEYAGWLCALGLHANHFTVSVNALRKLDSITLVLDFVEGLGYSINAVGGRVKGSREVLLEQGSTLADRVSVPFADGTHQVPTCYYEFALRYPQPNGALYEGFVPTSADRIFESTHRTA